MAKKRKQARRRSRQEWARLVAEYRRSGQSQSAFAQSRGLGLASLARWSRLLGREDERATGDDREGGLIELVADEGPIRATTPEAEGARLLVGRSVCLELPHWPAPDYVAQIARAYEAVSAC